EDAGLRREPHGVRQGRPGQPSRGEQRLLHHELPCPDLPRAPQGGRRHREGSDDYHPCLH
ncbi:unnamed protein product, partial [Symbiodinium sp. KB8]